MIGTTVAQVIVRNLDGRVVNALKARAALHGQSLEQELRDILTRACGLSGADRAALANRIRALQPHILGSGTEALIREERDRR
jgi:plasmid stability protein